MNSAHTSRHVRTKPNAIDIGHCSYQDAYALQLEHHKRVLADRHMPDASVGSILFVEHDPVITVSKRPSALQNLVATTERLESLGVDVQPTDRGGDITYHGPGQIVAYPIVDLNAIGINLHEYMRRLEEAVLRTCAHWNIDAQRDPTATGVWVPTQQDIEHQRSGLKKIAAMGVRVRRWITMHGLSLNVAPNLEHFALIVPCGLAGREVTHMQAILGEQCPSMINVKRVLSTHLVELLSPVARS